MSLLQLKVLNLVDLIILLSFVVLGTFVLTHQQLIVGFKLLVPSFERFDPSSGVFSDFSKLLAHGVLFNSFSVELGVRLDELRCEFLIVVLQLLQISEIALQSFIHLNLYEFLQALIMLHAQLHVGLF